MNSRIAAASSSIEIATTCTFALRAASASSLGNPLLHGLHHDAHTSMTRGAPRVLVADHAPPATSGSINAGSGTSTAADFAGAGAVPAQAASTPVTSNVALVRIARLLSQLRP